MISARKPHYGPLNLHAEEIRLFSFNKVKGGAIRGGLEVFPLSKCPQYIAISYTWGEDAPRRIIYLNGKEFRLRENIYQAIKAILRLRARSGSHDQIPDSTAQAFDLQKKLMRNQYFWIDSICIQQNCTRERTHQVGLMDKIFSHAQFVVAWLGPSSKGTQSQPSSIEVMQSIRNYVPPSKPVNFSMTHILFPEHLHRSINVFDYLDYWSRSWIIQEIVLAKDVLVLWGDEYLSWEKLKDLLLGCAMFLGAPLKNGTAEHMGQDTLEKMPPWMRVVLLREQIAPALKNREAPHDTSRDDEDDEQARTLPTLYSLIFSCVAHGCKEPRDKVISLLGLLPDTTHLIDYSSPINQYFQSVCDYAFDEAKITDPMAKENFRVYLGYSLDLPAYPSLLMVETPPFKHAFTKSQFLAFRTTNIPYELPEDIRVLSELIYFDSKRDIKGVATKF